MDVFLESLLSEEPIAKLQLFASTGSANAFQVIALTQMQMYPELVEGYISGVLQLAQKNKISVNIVYGGKYLK